APAAPLRPRRSGPPRPPGHHRTRATAGSAGRIAGGASRTRRRGGRGVGGRRPRPLRRRGARAVSAAGAAGFGPVSVIAARRDGQELTGGQIDAAIAAYTSGRMAEEQMAALLMAVYLRGMTAAETVRWTAAMTDSGARLDFTDLRRAGRALPAVDKHSTGGVGDTVTVMLAPLVAACGAAVPQLSGRGLGHTGGTLDKLEAIPGWRAEVPADRMREILRESGAVVCAAGADLAPADRKMYALRDVTGTVESIPLIAASIMSKKIAEGAGALVLDVKVGRGAFMTDLP